MRQTGCSSCSRTAQITMARNAAPSTKANAKCTEKDSPSASDANAQQVNREGRAFTRFHTGIAIAVKRKASARLWPQAATI